MEFWNTVDGSTLGSRLSFDRNDSGVLVRPASANAEQRNIILATFKGIEKAYEWTLKNLLGKPYDWYAILGIARGDAAQHDKNARFCSETIVESALKGAGVKLLNCDPWDATPRDVLISPLVERLHS